MKYCNKTKVKNYFLWDLLRWIALPFAVLKLFSHWLHGNWEGAVKFAGSTSSDPDLFMGTALADTDILIGFFFLLWIAMCPFLDWAVANVLLHSLQEKVLGGVGTAKVSLTRLAGIAEEGWGRVEDAESAEPVDGGWGGVGELDTAGEALSTRIQTGWK